MEPLTIALLGAGAGALIAGPLGWLFGHHAANAEIKALRERVIQLVEINQRREAEIRQLRERITTLEREVAVIRAQRNFIQRFLRWILREEPQILARFRQVEESEEAIVRAEQARELDAAALDDEVRRLKREYPERIAVIEQALR